ncbi:MAG: universal stress protein [Candidatus Nitrosopolaris sp.]
MTTETHATSENDRKEIEIKNILVPIDGSEYSLHAALNAIRIARNEKAQLFCIHVVTPQRFKFFHRHASSTSPSSDYSKQEPPEQQRLVSHESLPVYDSESNEFVGEVEIPIELQLMSQELHGHMTNFVKNKIESWFDSVRNMAKDEGIFDIKTEIFFDAKSIIESIIEYATQKNIDLIVIGTRGRTGLKRFFMGSVANGVVQHAHCSVLLVR